MVDLEHHVADRWTLAGDHRREHLHDHQAEEHASREEQGAPRVLRGDAPGDDGDEDDDRHHDRTEHERDDGHDGGQPVRLAGLEPLFDGRVDGGDVVSLEHRVQDEEERREANHDEQDRDDVQVALGGCRDDALLDEESLVEAPKPPGLLLRLGHRFALPPASDGGAGPSTVGPDLEMSERRPGHCTAAPNLLSARGAGRPGLEPTGQPPLLLPRRRSGG